MGELNIINLTSHPIRVMNKVFESEGNARVMIKEKLLYHNNDIGVIFQANVYGDVIGLPEPKENTIYIVSKYVFTVLHHRKDLAFPGRHLEDGDGDAVSENLIVHTDFIISKFSNGASNNTGVCGDCPNKNIDIPDNNKLKPIVDIPLDQTELKRIDREVNNMAIPMDCAVNSQDLNSVVYSEKSDNFNNVGDAIVRMMTKKKKLKK